MYLARSPIHSDAAVMGGTLVFRTTRVPAQSLLDYLRDGYSVGEFLAMFPSVDREEAKLFLELACGTKHPTDADGNTIVGDPQCFAFQIWPSEPNTGGQMRVVDIVLAGTVLRRRDNWVYVPHFAGTLQETSKKLKSTINWSRYEQEFGDRNVAERHEVLRANPTSVPARLHDFMDWGESTDDIISFQIPHFDRLYLTYQIGTQIGGRPDYSVVNGVEVQPFDLICVLDETADFLHRGLQPPEIKSVPADGSG